MSARHPIVAVTGSSGAGTSSTRPLFERAFAQLSLQAAFVDGDSFHAYDREQMRAVLERARIRGENFSHFGPAANLWDRLEALFRDFGETGSGAVRSYLHTEAEARQGHRNCFITGEIMSFASVEYVCQYSRSLVDRFF